MFSCQLVIQEHILIQILQLHYQQLHQLFSLSLQTFLLSIFLILLQNFANITTTLNSNLQFDFIVNKENNTVNVKREFAADLELVWEAWTNPKILDQWWAPKPYRTETKSMDFREGGMWLYAMISPQDEKHWCKNDYCSFCSYIFSCFSGCCRKRFNYFYFLVYFDHSLGKASYHIGVLCRNAMIGNEYISKSPNYSTKIVKNVNF